MRGGQKLAELGQSQEVPFPNRAPEGGFRVTCVPHGCAGRDHNLDASSGMTHRRDFTVSRVLRPLGRLPQTFVREPPRVSGM